MFSIAESSAIGRYLSPAQLDQVVSPIALYPDQTAWEGAVLTQGAAVNGCSRMPIAEMGARHVLSLGGISERSWLKLRWYRGLLLFLFFVSITARLAAQDGTDWLEEFGGPRIRAFLRDPTQTQQIT
jgi:hypothetical protein